MPVYGTNNGAAAQPDVPRPVAGGGDAAGAARLVPFVRAAQKAVMRGEEKSGIVLGASTQNVDITLQATGGWMRKVTLMVECTTAANAAAVTFAADGPWNVLQNVIFRDAAQNNILQLTGYELHLANLFGAYTSYPGYNSARSYSAVAGVGAGLGGSFRFFVDIPMEFAREALGCLANQDASSRYQISLSINQNSAIYGTPPTSPGTLKITPIISYYQRPPQIDAHGRACDDKPRWGGAMQYWRTIVTNLVAGDNVIIHPLSGRYLRNVWLVTTTAGDARDDTVMPVNFQVELDNTTLQIEPRVYRDNFIYRSFGVDAPTGVYLLHTGTLDPDGVPIGEWGDQYLETTLASALTIRATTGAAGKGRLVLNEIMPPAGQDIFRY